MSLKSLIIKTPIYFFLLYSREKWRQLTTYKVDRTIRSSLEKKHKEDPLVLHTLLSLKTNGVAILDSFFSGEKLTSMQEEFDHYLASTLCTHNMETKTQHCNDTHMFSSDSSLKLFSKTPILKDIATYYWGQPLKLISSFGYRLEPQEPKEYSSFQWHHDCKRKQLKVFVLLKDLNKEDQVLLYAPGTHKKLHIFSSYEDSRFSGKNVEEMSTPVTISGKAGTVFFIDTNGLHKGVRNLSKNRDLWCNLLVPQHFSDHYTKTNTLMKTGLMSINI